MEKKGPKLFVQDENNPGKGDTCPLGFLYQVKGASDELEPSL